MRKVNTSELKGLLSSFHAGEEILLSGTVYTARDAVHKRFAQLIAEGKPLPIELSGAVIYYAGPTPSKNGLAVGSCGPTTSSRMDKHTPMLLERGLSAIIGKGERNESVISSLVQNGAVYFCAIGGAGALYASCIESVQVVAFEELGCESLKKMTVKDFPLIVGIDSYGGNIFDRKNA
ncbi:MAG: fumarate hydratase C-terminal domain-containing protein [Clostridia bacterium]|nr:fumarate hydratase C-terminal domain-containing protein [Clostridia bacterium]